MGEVIKTVDYNCCVCCGAEIGVDDAVCQLCEDGEFCFNCGGCANCCDCEDEDDDE